MRDPERVFRRCKDRMLRIGKNGNGAIWGRCGLSLPPTGSGNFSGTPKCFPDYIGVGRTVTVIA